MPVPSRPSLARPPLTLDTEVTNHKGVGPVRAQHFARLGIRTAGDLLRHIPHRYEDASTVAPIRSLAPGMDATVLGRVISKGILPTRKGLRVFSAVLHDATGMIEASWPGQAFLDRTIQKGDLLLATGPVRFFHGRQLAPREFVNLGPDDEGTAEGRVLAVYPATEGLSFKVIRGIIEQHLPALLPLVHEFLPPEVLAEGGVMPLPEALRLVHRPTSVAEAMTGRARLAYEELLFVQLLHRRAKALAREPRGGRAFENRREFTAQLKAALPFELTGAQTRAVREIVADMTSPQRMHRLLQGDVGSGKTVVGLFAAMLAMENGWQVAFMAPTELLAEQHHRTATRLLAPLGIVPVLVTGSMGAKARRAAAAIMAEPAPALVIGTHALVSERAEFAKLGLVIVDEQHRFGVEQRAALGAKGDRPDVLLMSATPIPRSLALTLYGDLDLTILDERPPGRQPITTALRRENGRERVLTFARQQVEAGRQVYVVYPVIAESEKTDLKAATTMYEQLAAGAFAGLEVALLHGKLKGDEKDSVMRRFLAGEVQVLVATTVIEVGIDVPNATVMIIEHPERFGLSQLHQLRGRVGRGAEQSYCILLGDVSPESAERLQVFVDSEDGFEIARADLEQRGMGDLFGDRQSGMPGFRVADPLRDETLNAAAGLAAERLLEADPTLERKEHLALRRVLTTQFQRGLALFHVG